MDVSRSLKMFAQSMLWVLHVTASATRGMTHIQKLEEHWRKRIEIIPRFAHPRMY